METLLINHLLPPSNKKTTFFSFSDLIVTITTTYHVVCATGSHKQAYGFLCSAEYQIRRLRLLKSKSCTLDHMPSLVLGQFRIMGVASKVSQHSLLRLQQHSITATKTRKLYSYYVLGLQSSSLFFTGDHSIINCLLDRSILPSLYLHLHRL